MSTTKAILSALWRSRNARRLQPAQVPDWKAAIASEFYRRELRDSLLAEVSRRGSIERYDASTEAGRRWVTIGAHDHEGGTPVQIDGSGNIVKGPPALKGQPADNPDAGKAPAQHPAQAPAQDESQDDKGALSFDETAANSSLSKSGKAEHGGVTVEIVDNPEGKQWGYAARVTKADGSIEHVSNQGQGKGTSWREAQGQAVKALRGAAGPSGAQTATKEAQSPEKQAPKAGDLAGAEKADSATEFRLERPKNAPHQPAERQAELFETKGGSDLPSGVVELADGRRVGATVSHVSDLHVDPDRFQYKFAGIDPRTGVTKELKEVTAWNPMFAGAVMIWRDPKDGKDYVINGHHRAELAKRAVGKPLSKLPPGMEHDPAFKDADGNYNGKMRTMYIAAETAAGARAAGAITNIAEGRGKPIDAAKFMRDSGLGVDGFKQMGISLEGAVAENGAILAGLSNKIFQAVAQGTLPEGRALAIGRHVSKPEFQDKLLSIIDKRENKKGQKTKLTDAVVSEMAREMSMAGSATVQGKDLFGDFESEESLFVERGELTAGLRAAIGADARIFGELGKRGREERLSEAGNVLNQEENTRRAQESAEAAWTFNQLAHSKGPISDAINTYAGELKNAPGRKKTIIRQLTERIREIIGNGGKTLGNEAGGTEEDRGANRDDADGAGSGTGARGAGSTGATAEESGSVKEQFSREFARRDLVAAVLKYSRERYAAPVPVVETSRKRSQVAANYRPAFGAARCGTCEFFRAGACSHVSGQIREFDMCDLYFPSRHDGQAVEHFAKGTPAAGHLFDESKIERNADGEFAKKGGAHESARNSAAKPTASGIIEASLKELPRLKSESQKSVNYQTGDEDQSRKDWVSNKAHETVKELSEDDYVSLLREHDGRKDMAMGNAVKLLGRVTGLGGGKRAKEVAAIAFADVRPTRFTHQHYNQTQNEMKPTGGIDATATMVPTEAVWRAIHRAANGKVTSKPAESLKPPDRSGIDKSDAPAKSASEHEAFGRSHAIARREMEDARKEYDELSESMKKAPPRGKDKTVGRRWLAEAKDRYDTTRKHFEALDADKENHRPKMPAARMNAAQEILASHTHDYPMPKHGSEAGDTVTTFPVRWKSDKDRNEAADKLRDAFGDHYAVDVGEYGVTLHGVANEREYYSKDNEGHEHKGKGPGGGQFTSGPGGSGGSGDSKPTEGGQHAPAGQPGAQAADSAPAETPDDNPTPPPPGDFYSPDPKDGKSSRVGVGAFEVPPPPAKIARLPNLNKDERVIETGFAEAFEADPDGMAGQFLAKMAAGEGDLKPNVFGTDNAKCMHEIWGGAKDAVSDPVTKANRARFNTALHTTANAIAKRAFVRYLDETVSKLPEENRYVLMTAGGVASGKGYAIKNVPEIQASKLAAGAVWDAAGEQNSLECAWVAAECRARGIRIQAVYVHADPEARWTNPTSGVVQRAGNEGRMVDARLYADSYEHGAKNFAAWAETEAGAADVKVAYLDGTGAKVEQSPAMPQTALSIDADQVYATATQHLASMEGVDPAVSAGGLAGGRIWVQAHSQP